MQEFLRIFFLFTVLQLSLCTDRIVWTKADGNHLNIIVYICPDPTLQQYAINAVSQFSTTEEINNYLTQKVDGYNDQIWSITVVNFSRITGDLLPGGSSSQNLCFLSVDKENLVIIMAAVSEQLK